MKCLAELVLGHSITFADTSNVRYHSYGGTASELLVHREFLLGTARDKKEAGTFTNLEQIYHGF